MGFNGGHKASLSLFLFFLPEKKLGFGQVGGERFSKLWVDGSR